MVNESLAVKFRLSPPIGPVAVRAVRKSVCLLARQWSFDAETCAGVGLALSEALNNAREHTGRGPRVIDVTCRIAFGEIRLVVEDSGTERDGAATARKAFESSTGAPDPGVERGRGFYLMRRLMDEVELRRTTSGGVRIAMIKRTT